MCDKASNGRNCCYHFRNSTRKSVPTGPAPVQQAGRSRTGWQRSVSSEAPPYGSHATGGERARFGALRQLTGNCFTQTAALRWLARATIAKAVTHRQALGLRGFSLYGDTIRTLFPHFIEIKREITTTGSPLARHSRKSPSDLTGRREKCPVCAPMASWSFAYSWLPGTGLNLLPRNATPTGAAVEGSRVIVVEMMFVEVAAMSYGRKLVAA